jgi:NhaA family Na+:H+ antiporter
VLLLVAVAVALIWANASASGYETFWHTRLVVRAGSWSVAEDLRHWVNDGLMSLFFLVVGLEIKREFLTGELRDRSAAVLPVVAAVGGMAVPALIYVALTSGSPAARGWGAAMPTDLVFALGVLALARGVPSSLKAFLLVLAIVDDVGSILVVALVYSKGVDWGLLAVAAGLCVSIVVLERIHVRSAAVYVALGVGVWLALHAAGVSGTVAGVTLGILTPSVPFQRPKAVSEEAHRVADETVDDPFPPDADAAQWLYLADLSREAVSPLARVESVLHPWTSYLVVPLFAVANAGVVLSGHALAEAATSRVGLGIIFARVLGKTLGITGACWLAVRLGIARLPAGSRWGHMWGVAAAAGVPFTVSLFVAELSLPSAGLVVGATVGIFTAALISGILGVVVLRATTRR